MENLRHTSPNKLIGGIRIMLGIIFLMTGMMTLFMADYTHAFDIQLTLSEIPMKVFFMLFIPVLEVVMGIILLVGFYTKIGALLALPIMLVAIYVHLIAVHPDAFPSQPQAPIMPVMVIIMAVMVLMKGGASWSMDLKLLSA